MLKKNQSLIKDKFAILRTSKPDKDETIYYLKVAGSSIDIEESDEIQTKSNDKLFTKCSNSNGAPPVRKMIDLPKDFTTSRCDTNYITRAESGTETTACETVSTTSNDDCDTMPLIEDLRIATPPRRSQTQGKRNRFKLLKNSLDLEKREFMKKKDFKHKFVSCGSDDSEKREKPNPGTNDTITKISAEDEENHIDLKENKADLEDEVNKAQYADLESERDDKNNERSHVIRTSRRMVIPARTLISSSQSSSFDEGGMDSSRHISLFDTLTYQSSDTHDDILGKVEFEEQDEFDKMRLMTSQYQSESISDASFEGVDKSFSTKKIHASYEPSSLSQIGERLGGYQGSNQLFQATPDQNTTKKLRSTSTNVLNNSVRELFSPKPANDNDVKTSCDVDHITNFSSSILANFMFCGASCKDAISKEYKNLKK